MSIKLLKSISTQKAHKTYYKQGSILRYLGTNQFSLKEAYQNRGRAQVGFECYERFLVVCISLEGLYQNLEERLKFFVGLGYKAA